MKLSSERLAIAATHERLLYEYTFAEDVRAIARSCDEAARSGSFRRRYAAEFQARLRRFFPSFVRMHGPVDVRHIVEYRIELRDGSRGAADVDYLFERAERLLLDHPQGVPLRELLRIERATCLASQGPRPTIEQLRADIRDLGLLRAGESVWDGAALHYIELLTSLKESLPTRPRDVDLFRWTVRNPYSRPSVIYKDPRSGRVGHWCFTSLHELASDVERRARSGREVP